MHENIIDRHSDFLTKLRCIQLPWALPSDSVLSPSDISGKFSATVNLKGKLGPGVSGVIVYQLRKESYLRDLAQYDDNISIEFDPRRIDYDLLLRQTIPKLIDAFKGYRATIYSESLGLRDWQHIVAKADELGKDVDGRDGVYRFNAVNYFDAELCKRAFKSTPQKIYRKLSKIKEIEVLELIGDGVYFVFNSNILDDDELDKINEKYLDNF